MSDQDQRQPPDGIGPTRESPGPYGFSLCERLRAALAAFVDPTVHDPRRRRRGGGD